MKIRKGFVSNSSSSSFMAIFNSDLVPEIMEDLGPEEIALLEQTTRKEELGDIELVIYYIDHGEACSWELNCDKFKQTVFDLAKVDNKKSKLEEYIESYEDMSDGVHCAIGEVESEASEALKKVFKELNKENKCIIIDKYY